MGKKEDIKQFTKELENLKFDMMYEGDFFLQELTKPVGRMSTLALRWPMVR